MTGGSSPRRPGCWHRTSGHAAAAAARAATIVHHAAENASTPIADPKTSNEAATRLMGPPRRAVVQQAGYHGSLARRVRSFDQPPCAEAIRCPFTVLPGIPHARDPARPDVPAADRVRAPAAPSKGTRVARLGTARRRRPGTRPGRLTRPGPRSRRPAGGGVAFVKRNRAASRLCRCNRRHTMATAKNLDTLFLDELRDLYDAEKQLTKALPKLARNASS